MTRITGATTALAKLHVSVMPYGFTLLPLLYLWMVLVARPALGAWDWLTGALLRLLGVPPASQEEQTR